MKCQVNASKVRAPTSQPNMARITPAGATGSTNAAAIPALPAIMSRGQDFGHGLCWVGEEGKWFITATRG
ncbi:hypothetical protein GCM10025871_41250 [Deinococcus metallilatus]|nr:hypothetical protein GCM10025871_41250 [Deinococcus metallilatus]